MNAELERLIAAARGIMMTPAEREEQRRSFAYGNDGPLEPAGYARDDRPGG
jgi:hypothetical protein